MTRPSDPYAPLEPLEQLPGWQHPQKTEQAPEQWNAVLVYSWQCDIDRRWVNAVRGEGQGECFEDNKARCRLDAGL